MQQSHLTTYADIAEVRTVTGAAICNQLLAEGWVLLGVLPLTRVAEMTAGQEERKQDIRRYVRRFVGYVVGRRREGKIRKGEVKALIVIPQTLYNQNINKTLAQVVPLAYVKVVSATADP